MRNSKVLSAVLTPKSQYTQNSKSINQKFYSTGGIIKSPLRDSLSTEVKKEKQKISEIIAENRQGVGRAGISGIVATVFGASGFLGKYVVNELGAVGSQVVVPFRGEENNVRHLKILGDLGQIVPLQCDVNDPSSIEEVISRSNVVVNLIGKRWETLNYSFDHVHNKIAANIAKASKKVGTEKFVHVSSLGASPNSASKYLQSKYAGEAAVKEILPDAVIVRPGGVYGYEDRLLNKWGTATSLWPFLPILKGHEDRKENYLCIDDFSTAMYRIITNDNDGQTFDLGGPAYSTRELLESILDATWSQKKIIPIPPEIALNVTKFTQYLRRSRFTHDEMLALTEDCLINPKNSTLQDLGITPTILSIVCARYVKHYRRPSLMMDPQFEK